MQTVKLGRTGIEVNKNGFGALPFQRCSKNEAVSLLHKAYEGGIRFFDTARSYSDSEEKIGLGLADVRGNIILATKTPAQTAEGFWADLEESLRLLKTDTIDIFQFHNPAFCPRPGDESGLYGAALKAKEQGKIRFIGLSNHRLKVAKEAILSGLYDTLQFPFSYLAGPQEEELVRLSAKNNIGFIAMKALAGGLITDAATAYAWMCRYPGALPIWGIQRRQELEEFLALQNSPPSLTPAQKKQIEKDREALAGEFCRGCGYCLPCPQNIEINNGARMSLLLRRSPPAGWLTPEWQAKMEKIETCIHCGRCAARCPYNLDTPALLQNNLKDYRTFL